MNLFPTLSLQEELDIRPKVSSLLSRLVSYTNITQGAKEHEEEESAQASRRKTPKVRSQGHTEGTLYLTVFIMRILGHLRSRNIILHFWLAPCLAI